VLRSQRLGKRVIPCLTNAHNFTARSIGIYRFLCELGREAVPSLGLDWGPLDLAPYRPRVRVGNVVLSLERWRIGKDELEPLGRAKGVARYQAVQQLRAKHRMPRFITVVDRDNVLPVDLDNALAIESFVHLVKQRDEVVVEELAPGGDELCVEGPEGRFCHELVVPFVRERGAPPVPSVATVRSAPSVPSVATERSAPPVGARIVRTFPPGSEWLYAKLYTGNATADHVLRAIAPMIADALATGAVDSWFFIRYGDPDWHIRLRLHGSPARLAAAVLPALHDAVAPLFADGRLWKLQLDTYVREIERYGGAHGIALAEQWFDVDSRTALAIVELLDGDAGADARWRLAFRGIDQLLDDLGLDLEAKQRVIRRARDSFAAEFAIGTPTTRSLGDKYRKERTALELLLDRTRDADHPLAPGLALITKSSPRVRAIGDALRAAERAGRLTSSIERLAGSYSHMLVNRLLRGAARQQELVLYDLLDRSYTSRLVRASKQRGGAHGP
jgi:thiopeptide-type bacteriocin biosynthesis protein